jgi:hypothetical protein
MECGKLDFAASGEPDDQHDDRDEQEQMDQPSAHVYGKASYPRQDQYDDEDV